MDDLNSITYSEDEKIKKKQINHFNGSVTTKPTFFINQVNGDTTDNVLDF